MLASAPPLIPSYAGGFNRFAQHPGLKFLVAPWLGPTGLTLYDHSLEKKHGALANMTTSDWATCQYGAYLDLDGVNDRIDHPNVVPNAGPLTMMCWIRPDDITHRGYLFCHEEAGAFSSIFGMTSNLNGDVEVIFEFTGNDIRARTGGGVLTQGEWQQITITWPGTVTAADVHFYRNGRIQAHAFDQNATLAFALATGGWIIGGRTADNLRNFDGKFFMLAWWNRVLSSDEIFQRFHDPHYDLREVE